MNSCKTYQTKQRIAIKDIFKQEPKKYYTAEQIYMLLSNNSTPVSKATLYRTLDNLEKNDEIIKYSLQSQSYCYQLNTSENNDNNQIHFRCEHFGSLLHLENKNACKISSEMKRKYGLVVDISKTVLHGICCQCLGGSHEKN